MEDKPLNNTGLTYVEVEEYMNWIYRYIPLLVKMVIHTSYSKEQNIIWILQFIGHRKIQMVWRDMA